MLLSIQRLPISVPVSIQPRALKPREVAGSLGQRDTGCPPRDSIVVTYFARLRFPFQSTTIGFVAFGAMFFDRVVGM